MRTRLWWSSWFVMGALATGCGEQTPATGSGASAADSAPDVASSSAPGSAEAPAQTQAEKPDVPARDPGVLLVGDAAPPLSASDWYRGEPRTAVAAGRVTLVEFWATWCGPCIQVMPHITEMAGEYQDQGLDVVAVSIDSAPNAAKLVRNFVKDRADIVGFDVMLDDGKTQQTWFEAAGRSGIPSSFVVSREGRIAWIGHPMMPAADGSGTEIERVIRGLLDGTYDIDAAASESEAASEDARIAAEAAAKAEKEIEALSAEMGRLWSAGDRRGVNEYIDKIVALDAEGYRDLAQRKIEILLYELGEPAEALAAARALLNGPYEDDAMMKLTLASLFSGKLDPGEDGRAFAIETAEQVVAATDGTEPSALAVLAEAFFAADQPERAADTMRAAMSHVDEMSPAHSTYEMVLGRYLSAVEPEPVAEPPAELAPDETASGG